MGSLFSDIRYAARNLLKRPGFTAIAVITLALGIGANSAIFSAVNALLFNPLPIPEQDRVVEKRNVARGDRHSRRTRRSVRRYAFDGQSVVRCLADGCHQFCAGHDGAAFSRAGRLLLARAARDESRSARGITLRIVSPDLKHAVFNPARYRWGKRSDGRSDHGHSLHPAQP